MIRKPRHLGHKIALVSAAICALLMLPALAGFVWMWQTRGVVDAWTPSALASVVFLGCCAGVLYAISLPQPLLLATDQAAVDLKI